MIEEKLIDKIHEVANKVKQIEDSQNVLVFHPTAIWQVKDSITNYVNPFTKMNALMFDNRIPAFVSFNLPVNTFAIMAKAKYEAEFKP